MRTRRAVAASCLLALAAPASATWSILIVDTRTGEIGLGSATCLTRFDLRENTPVLIAGRGAATAQSSVDASGRNRALIRDRLIQGAPPDAILAELALTDAAHQTRQYGFVDASGGTVTFTGSGAGAWAGGVTGSHGDLVWAVQGNVLSGPNVVEDAARAIVETPGDLPEKLMSAMRAAREAGGDGRCSCSAGNPTACGSPPPGDFKSAHIGYLLVARAEDRDASRAIYPDVDARRDFATPDVDADGRADFAAIVGQSGIAVVFNSTPPGSRLTTGDPIGVLDAGPGTVLALASADLNADGVDDLVFAATGPDRVGWFPGDGAGWFGPPVAAELPAEPVRLAAGDLDASPGAEVAVSAGDGVSVFRLEGAALAPAARVPATGPTGVAIADLGGPHADLVVAGRADGSVTVFRHDGSFAFGPWRVWSDPGLDPVDLAAGRIFEDGLGDVAVIGGSSRRMAVLRQTAPGVFAATQTPLLGTGRRVAIGRFTPDGLVGLVTLSSGNRTVEIHRRRADQPGAFEPFHALRIAPGQQSLAVADTNGDGLSDIVSGGQQRGLTLLDNLGDGTFPEYNGFANGDYFLALNVADALDAWPDPVDTLSEQFAAWREGLNGRIDAVRTEVSAPSRVARGAAYTVRVRARDWRGEPVADVAGVEAFVVAGDARIVGVRTTEPGVAEIDVEASDGPGVDRIGVRLAGLAGTVRLMPDAAVRVLEDLADFNADGARNFYDVRDFLAAFGAGDPGADLDGDGNLTFADMAAFVAAFVG